MGIKDILKINLKPKNANSSPTSINEDCLDRKYYPLLKRAYQLYDDPILIFDLNNYQILNTNDSFLNVFQFSEDELKNVKISELNIFKDSTKLELIIKELKEYGFFKDFTIELKTKHQVIKTVLFNGVTENIDSKLHAFCILKDVTFKINIEHLLRTHRNQFDKELTNKTNDLIKSEIQLKENLVSEKNYADIVRKAPLGIAIGYADGRLERPNQAFADLVGYTIDELKEVDWNEKLTPENWRNIEAKHLETLSPDNNSITYEKEYIHKDGSLIPVKIIAKANYNELNQLINYAGFISNISKSKSHKKRLYDSEAKYQNLIENSAVAASTTNLDGEIIYANKTYAKIFGFKSVNDLLKKNVVDNNQSSFGWKHPEDREKMIEILKKDGYINNYEILFETKDGKEIYIRVSANLSDNLIHGLFMDISKEKESEKLIKYNEERYRLLYDNAIAALIRTDVESGNPIEANNAAASLFGYASIEALKENFNKTHHFIKPDRKTLIKKLQKGEQIEKLKIKCQTVLGVIFWVEATLKPCKKNICIDFVLVDITDKVREYTTNLKLSKAINQSPECIYMTDADGNIEYANEKLSKLIGYSNKELIGANPRIWNSGYHDKTFHKNLWDTITSGKIWKGEMRNKTKSGELQWHNGSIAPIINDDGNVTHYVAVMEDVTEKKQTLLDLKSANKKIKASEKLYRGLINNLSSGIVVHNADTSIMLNNNRASEFLGIDSEKLLGKQAIDPDWYFTNYDNIKLPIEKYPVNIIKKTKKSLENYVVGVNRPKTQDKVWLLVNGFPVIDDSGEISEIVISFVDFTTRKVVEDELIIAKEKAEQSDRLKSAFLANISHEIRTPMNGILGFAELLKDKDITGEEQTEYLEMIEESGDRMLHTIQDIVDISKIESGVVTLNYSDVNLNDQLHYVNDFFKHQAEIKGLQMFYKNGLPDSQATIKSDQQKIASIFTNLLNNAIKYTKEGSITFGYEFKDVNNKKEVRLFVKDTGIGIPQAKQNIIFDRFMQADVNENRAYEGSGLGLSIAKAYVEMLDGKIWLESEEGVGSKFCVSLPYESVHIESNEGVITKTPIDLSASNKKIKILVVDDDRLVKVYLGVLLKDINKEVFYAENGHEAIEIVKENSDIDLIIMDVRMPEMNGFEATKKIREKNKDVKIIIQSAFIEVGEEQEALDSGANIFLSKPIDRNKLVKIIKSINKFNL